MRTLTQTCPDTNPSGGLNGPFSDPDAGLPYSAANWAALAPGEVRFTDAASRTIAPAGGNPGAGQAYDPIGRGGACATFSGSDVPGTASYRLAAAPLGGFTLMGSPTIVADINSVGPNSQVAARLLDIDPGNGDATLVARGLYRPHINVGTDPTRQVFQLHLNGWHFAEGHIAKLELLPNDSPYGRVTNGQAPVTVSDADRDGIPDSQDSCPNQAGPPGSRGCPPSTLSPPGASDDGTKKKCKLRKKKGGKSAESAKRKPCKIEGEEEALAPHR